MHELSKQDYVTKEDLATHFREHFSLKNLPTPPELESPENFIYLKDKVVDIDETPPNAKEIKTALNSFKNNKSFGTDKLPSEGLKYQNSQILLSYLVILLSLIWRTVTIPKQWLENHMTCLYKKGQRTLAENYRALSVGSTLSKLVPLIILKRLQNSYETNISDEQFGFRNDRSTCDAIFILKNVIQKYGKEFMIVFIDLTAAYDHIPHNLLFKVLELRTGSKILTNIIKKMYEGTFAKIPGCKTIIEILCGCRQGGIESPTLFNYYFDYVLKICASEIDMVFPDGAGLSFQYLIPIQCTNREQRRAYKMSGEKLIKWLLYADDLALFSKSPNEANLILNIMYTTFHRFGLKMSMKKTKFMIFNQPNKTESPTILLNGHHLEQVTSFKYLGHHISIDNKSEFIDYKISHATSKFDQMNYFFKNKKIALATRIKILEACVRSRITYALQSWRPNETELKKLDTCWFEMLRKMIIGGYRRKETSIGKDQNYAYVYTNADILKITKTTSIKQFANEQYLKYIGHVCRKPNNCLTKLSLFFTPKAKYYRDPWINIAKLMGNISIEQAKKETQDRGRFIRLMSKHDR